MSVCGTLLKFNKRSPKEVRHEDFAVLGQCRAKIMTSILLKYTGSEMSM